MALDDILDPMFADTGFERPAAGDDPGAIVNELTRRAFNSATPLPRARPLAAPVWVVPRAPALAGSLSFGADDDMVGPAPQRPVLSLGSGADDERIAAAPQFP